MDTPRIPTNVYAEMTPNPAVMKFVADRILVPGGEQLEFRSKSEAMLCSPLATELFNFPFVTNVFLSGQIVSVTKDESLGWEMIVQQLREYIREWLMEHHDAVVEADLPAARAKLGTASHEPASALGLAPDAVKFIADEDIEATEHDEAISSKNLFARRLNRTEAPSISRRSRTAPCTSTSRGRARGARRPRRL